ncbi:519_t:CDS:2, partial [Racocetra persica]
MTFLPIMLILTQNIIRKRIIHFPVAFVHPVDTLDIQNTIKCGAKLNFPIVARSDGHSVNVTTAIIGAGNTIDSLYYNVYKYGFAYPSWWIYNGWYNKWDNAKEYPELLWAIRGAGNAGYGIVTALTFRIYPIQKI